MKKTKLKKTAHTIAKVEQAAQKAKSNSHILRLYLSGTTPQSQKALANIKRICEEHLQGRYELQVIDIYQTPALAKDEQIIAVPTLVKLLPNPLRRLIGDLSNDERVLLGLDIAPKPKKKAEKKRAL